MVINEENFLPDPNLTWGKNKSGALVISNSEKRPDLDPCRFWILAGNNQSAYRIRILNSDTVLAQAGYGLQS